MLRGICCVAFVVCFVLLVVCQLLLQLLFCVERCVLYVVCRLCLFSLLVCSVLFVVRC